MTISTVESSNQMNPLPKQQSDMSIESGGVSSMDGSHLLDHDDDVDVDSLDRSSRAEMARALAAKENRVVFVLRILVLMSLIVVATFMSAWVFVYSSNNEHDDFHANFATHANQIKEAFSDAVERKLVAIGTLSNAITSYAEDTSSKFPFVTVSNFATRGSDVRILGESFLIHWCPLVTEENREAWEDYALKNRFSINQAFEQDQHYIQQQDDFFAAAILEETTPNSAQHEQQPSHGVPSGRDLLQTEETQLPEVDAEANLLLDGTRFRPRIWNPVKNRTAEPEGSGPYWPSWQRTPVNQGRQQLINLNFASAKVFQGVLPVFTKDPKVVINRISVPLPSFHRQVTGNLRASQYRNHIDEYLQDPLSYLAYPVFDSFNTSTRTLAGALISNLYWRLHFQDVLPPAAKGIICVLENSFNQTFSYRIDGHDVTVLGPQDYHDPKYNDMVVFQDVTSYVKSRAGPETRAYLTVPLHESFGLYTLKIYPSQDTEAEYTTLKPVVFTLAVAFGFVLTALVFFAFNFWVERRQRVVKERAVNSGMIVDSLFPKQVQGRLYADATDAINSTDKKEAPPSWKADLKHKVVLAGRTGSSVTPADIPKEEVANKQIADFFKESTIMFGDLAGFTKWSSTRTPCEVFELLETLYNAFDKIALRRKVFKVETIGDCYLCVTGVPEPNPKHAVVMAKFAAECMRKMNDCVIALSPRLGADTETLQLRVGLHSGPVTAGVLRGQKARFQLFGDSVNTASRIETTGQPGRIHASQSTADQLISWNRGLWLEIRPDKVVAKGKGEMQTYWVKPTSPKTNGTTKTDDSCADSLNSGIVDGFYDSAKFSDFSVDSSKVSTQKHPFGLEVEA